MRIQLHGPDRSASGRVAWLLVVRDVHRLIDGMFYTNKIYTRAELPCDGRIVHLEFEADQTAFTTQLGEFDLAMTWNYHLDRMAAPRLALDGDHIYWAPN